MRKSKTMRAQSLFFFFSFPSPSFFSLLLLGRRKLFGRILLSSSAAALPSLSLFVELVVVAERRGKFKAEEKE